MKPEMNFIHQSLMGDKELFFGPIEADDGPFVELVDTWLLAHVMHHAELFKSVGDARKSGWNKPIPAGFSKFSVGKNKFNIFILNKLEVDNV